MALITLTASETATLASGGSVPLTLTGIAPPVVIVPPPVAAPKIVIYANGKSPIWPQNYSYDDSTRLVTPGNGNASCVEVDLSGPWAGFQPSNNPGQTTDFSKCTTLSVDVLSDTAGTPFTMQFLKGGDQSINSPNQKNSFTVQKANTWETFTFSIKASLMMVDNGTDVSGIIYKGAVQEHSGRSSGYFRVDNWVAQ